LHLRSIGVEPPSDNHVIDHGKIVDQDNRRLTMIESLAADDKGNVFMHGTWDALSADEASHQYVWPDMTQYYIDLGFAEIAKTYKGVKYNSHTVMHRGQFFSHVDVSRKEGEPLIWK